MFGRLSLCPSVIGLYLMNCHTEFSQRQTYGINKNNNSINNIESKEKRSLLERLLVVTTTVETSLKVK